MKRESRFILYLMAVASLMFVVTACTEKDDWTPGPQPEANNPGVYFDRNTPGLAEMDVDANLNLIQNYLVITLGRDPFKAGQALTVPINVHFSAPNLTVPDVVTFGAGEESAELRVTIGDYELSTPYGLSLEVDNKFANPYLSYAGTTEGGPSKVDLKIQVVAALGTATFTPGEYSKDGPEFTPFTHKIYINGDGSYTIKNFLYNNDGYDFNFKLDADNNIIPNPEGGYFEEGEGSAARWYFYSAPSSSSSNYIPCYIPSLNPADNIRYIYFYLDTEYRYTGFWLDIPARKGQMVGYSRYSVSSSGRITFDIEW